MAQTQGSQETSHTHFDYPRQLDLAHATDVGSAIRITMLNCLHYQLGWPRDACEAQARKEEERRLPRALIASLENTRGWRVEGARMLDVGAGQGGLLLELLHTGADAYGVEPGAEFRTLAALRLEQDGFEPARVIAAPGESLPFPDDHFDYAVSLQVLEHVRDPEPVLREMFRVLKPGGRCFISCENYLSFREQEYRVAWLPLLPKSIGARYLRLRGRDPAFLLNYVHYTTYPQIWRLCKRAGFMNQTYRRNSWFAGHLLNCLRAGVQFHLLKPVVLPDPAPERPQSQWQ
jgi:ubiquinone/menaquinone biosynthesis C-methylase UbiE